MFRAATLSAAVLLAALAPAAQAQVKLAIKHVEGSKASVEQTTKLHQVLSINGMDVETGVDQTMVVSSTVGTRKPDGSLPIEEKIDSLRAQFNIAGMTASFDSANPPTKKDEGPLAFLTDVFKALAGSTYTVTLDKNEKVLNVDGLQKVLDKAAELDPMAAKALKDELDVEKIKRKRQEEIGFLPEILVRPGDAWERTETMDAGGGQTLTFQKRYEYQGTIEKDGKTLDKIGVRETAITYEMDPNAESPAKVAKSDLKIDSSAGTILFDRNAGQVVERSGKTRIKGDLTLSINGQDLPSKLDLKIENASKLLK